MAGAVATRPAPSPICRSTFADVPRRNVGDLVRLLLAGAVIVSHSYALAGAAGSPILHDPFFYLTRRQMTAGDAAVDCFFILSGFLIARSWDRRRSAADFLLRRVLRIYPAFLLISVVTSLIVAPIGLRSVAGVGLPQLSSVLALRIDAIPNAFPAVPYAGIMNASAWTLVFEFQCYLLVLGSGLLGLAKSRPVNVIALAGCVSWLAMKHAIFAAPGDIHVLHFTACFLCGTTLYAFADRIPRRIWIALAAFVGLCLSARYGAVLWVIFPVLACYPLLYLSMTAVRWELTWDLSYGTYLYGWPVQVSLRFLWARPIDPLLLTAAALPLALACAAASWLLVESRCRMGSSSRLSP